jgi:hypothetical protein
MPLDAARAAQAQRLVQCRLERVVARFDRAVLLRLARAAAARAHVVVLAQTSVAPRELLLFAQVVAADRLSVRCSSGTPPRRHSAACGPADSATKLSPNTTAPLQLLQQRDRVQHCVAASASSSGTTSCDLGDGDLRDLPALARQGQRPHLPAARHHQVPALLLLLDGPRTRADLRARAHLLPVPAAGLLQRTQLAGPTAGARGLAFTAADNAFVRIADFARARAPADTFNPQRLHRILDRYAQACCPVLDVFAQTYHWSIMQAEYSTDLVFKSDQILRPLYEQLAGEAVLSVKAEQVATFLGKVTPQLAAEIGSRLSTRIIKHRFDACSLKLYDKFSRILRIETTTNDVSFFKHHRKVEHRSGRPTREVAPLKKSVYSLIDLREILRGCNQRYPEFLSSLDDHSSGQRLLERLSEPKPDGDRRLKGLNFFDRHDRSLLRAVQRPQFNIHGVARRDLIELLPELSPSRLSRQLRRLRALGVLKRAANTYRYYLTGVGRSVIAALERLHRDRSSDDPRLTSSSSLGTGRIDANCRTLKSKGTIALTRGLASGADQALPGK